ncbi:hypothetical protein R51_31330 [Bacillus safensis]|nr:hypothetical protein R51_31330 [Bacillus safensis]
MFHLIEKQRLSTTDHSLSEILAFSLAFYIDPIPFSALDDSDEIDLLYTHLYDVQPVQPDEAFVIADKQRLYAECHMSVRVH